MNQDIFSNCFKKLCASFDLDFEKKKSRMETYHDSKLGDLTEYAFLEIINKAKESLQVRAGFLPPIRELVNIYYNNTSRPQKAMPDQETFNQAKCPICDGQGFVVMEKEAYTYSGMCCTCKVGQIKQQATILGKNSGCYKDYLDLGYKRHAIETPKDSKIEDKLLKIAYEAQKREIPF